MSHFTRCARVSLFAALLVPGLACADWYVGVSAGRTNNEYLPTFSPAGGESIDDQDSAFKTTIGVDLSPSLAFELDYANLNSLVVATSPGMSTEIKAKAVGLSFVAKAQVAPNTQMFGRFGAGRWDSDLTVNGASASDSGADPLIGLGVAYRLQSAPLDLRLEWTQYQNVGQDVATSGTRLTGQNVDVIWFGLTYRIKLAPGP
jgi:hypothetical protein